MKYVPCTVITICMAIGVLLLGPISARAGWELYDDFNSGSINPTRWNVNTSGGSVTVQEGKAKFVHTKPAGKVYLSFKDPQSIKGVKAKIKMANASGDLSARIGGFVALTQQDEVVWQCMELRNNRIQAYLEAEDPTTYNTLYTIFYNQFRNPVTVIGKWFTVSETHATVNKYTYSSSGQGNCTFNLPNGILVDGGKTLLYIGTKSKDGTATGTVYVDNVYVLK